ncbi:MAG: CAP domain-containing protein [Oscillospiraceae bacterium]
MKYHSRIGAVLLSAAMAFSAVGMTCWGGSEESVGTDELVLSELGANVYNVTVGKTKIFTIKISGVSRIGAVSSDKSVAKITALSYKKSTVKVSVKGVSEGTAVIRVYDRDNKKKFKSITVNVSEAAAEDIPVEEKASSDSETTAITMGAVTMQISGLKKDPEVMKKEVLELINEERAKNGAEPLALNSTLAEAAQKRADECAQIYSHTRPDGSSCFTVFSEYDMTYSYAGENIAYGYTTAEDVVNGWLNSPKHRKNILSENYTETGIGYDPATNSWTQLFLG